MKNSIFMLGLLVGLSAFICITGCAEEAELDATHRDVRNDQEVSLRTNDDPPYHYYDNGLTGPLAVYGCTTPAINCFEKIIVEGEKLQTVNYLFDNIGSWSASQIQDFMDDNNEVMSELIGADEVDGIINGTYSFRTRGSASGGDRFMITRSGGDIISVTSIED